VKEGVEGGDRENDLHRGSFCTHTQNVCRGILRRTRAYKSKIEKREGFSVDLCGIPWCFGETPSLLKDSVAPLVKVFDLRWNAGVSPSVERLLFSILVDA